MTDRPDPAQDPVLRRFRDAVRAAYGDRLDQLILYGSRARGDFRADSDYDVAVFLHGIENTWHEMGVLANITTDILYDTGELISPVTLADDDYDRRTALLREVRRDGIRLDT